MAFTYDPTTDRGKVRLLIHDTDTADVDNQFFSDAEIDAFLSMNNQDVWLAAATGLDSLAADQAMTLKVMRILHLQTDGRAMAQALRDQAKQLREQHETAQGDYDGLFDWAEYAIDPFSSRERVLAQAIDEVS